MDTYYVWALGYNIFIYPLQLIEERKHLLFSGKH